MIYSLECGSCGEVTEVESDTPVTTWECDHCPAKSVTSLPTDEYGDLI